MNFQAAVVIDESELSKAVHEEIHPRSGRADHLREDFLTDLRDHVLRFDFLAEMGEQQQNARARVGSMPGGIGTGGGRGTSGGTGGGGRGRGGD